ncbi:unnamed protein product [Echinostoma caproni]|uniref:EF-hand domain-containing protein n=1 Tax=Echinostoma caproni TaxID=27848 RepID=A0A183AIL0_9TREM|nr:unnamed protein product [Echinostoma caproni]
MRRSMQKADHDGQGRVNAPVFRQILHEGTGVHLTDEQIYELLTSLDPELTGTLPYSRLLDNAEITLRNEEHSAKKGVEKTTEQSIPKAEEAGPMEEEHAVSSNDQESQNV